MRQASGKRWVAAVPALAFLLGTTLASYGQEILSTAGVPLGGLEPWDTPASTAECDQGIMARVTEILRPHVVQLNTAEKAVRDALAAQGWRAAAAEALIRQQAVCQDIFAVIGIVKRHNKEVSDWRLGESRNQYMLTAEFLTSDRLNTRPAADANVAPEEGTAQGQNHPGPIRWSHLSPVWVVFEVAFEFHREQHELLEQLGLSSAPWKDDSNLALYALLALLRQADMDGNNSVTLAKDIASFAEQTGAEYVEKYELGRRRAEPGVVAQEFETYLGRGSVVALVAREHTEEFTLELGSYRYMAVQPACAVTCMAQAGTPAPRAFLTRVVWPEQSPDVVAFWQGKSTLYAAVASELQERAQAATGENAARRTATLYAPYIWTLAHCAPCLSPFRPEVVGEGDIRFTEGWLSTTPESSAGLSQLEKDLNAVLAAKGAEPRTDLFLLQADFQRNAEGAWQWMPRRAGFRGYLNLRQETRRIDGMK